MLLKNLLFVACILPGNLIADSDLERQNLANLIGELNYLISRTNQYSGSPYTDQRIRFHYELLKADLVLIRDGINDHIAGSLEAGRKLKPLAGNYTDHSDGKHAQ